ncbi:hypothetical protein AAHE18_17G060000 [Arachis hypogaea]
MKSKFCDMKSFVLPCFTLLLLFIHTPSYTCSSSVLPLCNHDDTSNLLQFKNSFVVNTSLYKDSWLAELYCSSYPKTASWKNDTDCCEWDGVTCDTTSGHVIGLDLSCSMLQGELHPNSTLFHLTHLQQLNLAFNDLSDSSIYPGIGDLVSLTHLNLSSSALSGVIPSTISHLSKLVSLDLSTNIFRQNILRLDPSTWNRLILNATNLKELVLTDVNMSSVREDSLSLLMNLSSSLVSLRLDYTGLQENFPTAVLGLPNLQELILSENSMLRGKLPKSNWSAPLRVLDLYYTSFSGEIPDSIGQLKSLNQIWLTECDFDGLVPPSLWNLTQLTTLAFAANNFHGEIPSLLSNLKHLINLDLQENNFSGHIPDVFAANFTKLEFLALSSNNLGGQLPPSLFLERIQYLKALDLSNNQIEGVIPKWFNELLYQWNISFIDLSFNKLQGDLPNPPDGINYFSASNNNFTGGISPTICNGRSLNLLILSHNNLSGDIPQCLGTFPSLQVLDLQINHFYGSIPGNFSKKNAFKTIKLNGNQLEGPIPQSLAHCTNLEVLDLSDNNIQDVFPSRLEALQELQVLSLRNNKFHGTITCLSRKHPFPKLRIFDVSNNKFSGSLPMQYFQEFHGMMTLK